MRGLLSRFTVAALLVVPVAAQTVRAQDPPARPDTTARTLRIFLDCNTFCDDEFLQTEITYVNFVRDRDASDVHVIITSQRTGAGGEEYTITLLGRGALASLTDTVSYTLEAAVTTDERRRAQLRYLSLALTRYAMRTPAAANLTVTFRIPTQTQQRSEARGERDPWNFWVFRVSTNGGMSRETQQRSSRGSLSLSANRITQAWKLTNSTSASYSESKFTLSSGTFVNYSHSGSFNHLLVKSLGEHWSLGERVNLNTSTFLNYQLSARVAPAVEYNIFPYAQSTRRQFTLQYSLGWTQVRYEDTTLFNKLRDGIADQMLVAGAEAVQPWGSVFASLTASHHLEDVNRNRVTAFGSLNLRITRGLNLNFFGQASRIRDQINLAKGSLPDEEVLTRRRQLATGYRVNFNIGLSYTFGSIFSNVVNPRMRFGGGGEEGFVFFF